MERPRPESGEAAPVGDQRRLVLAALDPTDRLALAGLVALAVGATGAVVVERETAQEGLDEVRRGREAGALPVLLLGSRAGERDLARLARALGNRDGTVPMILFAPAPLELLAEVALSEGCADVLVRGRVSADGLVRSLRLAFEIARRTRAEEGLRARPAVGAEPAPPDLLAEARRFAALGRTVSAITHDLNNLLQPVLGYAELLQGTLEPGSRARRYAEQIERSARLAVALLGRALPTVRDRGEAPEAVVADERVLSLEELLRALVGRRLELEVAPGAPGARVVVRPGALEQILLNLAANGRDAMVEGGRLSIRTAVDHDGQWCLEVEDSGVGISAERMARLFEPGVSTKPAGKSGGLGLWIVRSLVEEAGGRLEMHSAEGRGTLVRLRLPLAPNAPAL